MLTRKGIEGVRRLMAQTADTTPAGSVLAGARGWAALAEWVERKTREARRQIRIAKKDNFCAGYEITHQHGRLAVLGELRKAFPRTKKAPPNERVHRSVVGDSDK